MGFATFGDYVADLPVSDRYVWMVIETHSDLVDAGLSKTEALAVIKEYGQQRSAAAVELSSSEEDMRSMLNKTHKDIDLSDRSLVVKKRQQKRMKLVVFFATEEQAVMVTEGMYKLEKELGISQATLIEYMVVSALQDPNFTSVDRIVDVDLLEQVAEQIEKESFDRKDKMM